MAASSAASDLPLQEYDRENLEDEFNKDKEILADKIVLSNDDNEVTDLDLQYIHPNDTPTPPPTPPPTQSSLSEIETYSAIDLVGRSFINWDSKSKISDFYVRGAKHRDYDKILSDNINAQEVQIRWRTLIGLIYFIINSNIPFQDFFDSISDADNKLYISEFLYKLALYKDNNDMMTKVPGHIFQGISDSDSNRFDLYYEEVKKLFFPDSRSAAGKSRFRESKTIRTDIHGNSIDIRFDFNYSHDNRVSFVVEDFSGQNIFKINIVVKIENNSIIIKIVKELMHNVYHMSQFFVFRASRGRDPGCIEVPNLHLTSDIPGLSPDLKKKQRIAISLTPDIELFSNPDITMKLIFYSLGLMSDYGINRGELRFPNSSGEHTYKIDFSKLTNSNALDLVRAMMLAPDSTRKGFEDVLLLFASNKSLSNDKDRRAYTKKDGVKDLTQSDENQTEVLSEVIARLKEHQLINTKKKVRKHVDAMRIVEYLKKITSKKQKRAKAARSDTADTSGVGARSDAADTSGVAARSDAADTSGVGARSDAADTSGVAGTSDIASESSKHNGGKKHNNELYKKVYTKVINDKNKNIYKKANDRKEYICYNKEYMTIKEYKKLLNNKLVKKTEKKPVKKVEKKTEKKPVKKVVKKTEKKPVKKVEKKTEKKPVKKVEKKTEKKPVKKVEKKTKKL